MLANHVIEEYLEAGKGHSDSSMMYLRSHNQYIACVYPKCDCNLENFPQITFGINTIKLFLFNFCGM